MTAREYPEIPSDREDDLHNLEYLEKAQLILFMAGNQFMVMKDLLFDRRKSLYEVISGHLNN